jgi:hypothetical protein
MDPIQFEFNVEKTATKEEIEKILLQILEKLNIIKAKDVKSIFYFIDRTSEFVYKIKIELLPNTAIDADAFWKAVSDNQDLKAKFEIYFSGWKLVNGKRVAIGHEDEEDGIYVGDFDSSDGDGDEELVKVEKCFYNSPLETPSSTTATATTISDSSSFSLINDDSSANTTITTNDTSYSSTTDHTDDNNTLEFFSLNNQIITLKDLELLILFLENLKSCGGGDIKSYSLHESSRILRVDYEQNLVKQRVLKRKFLSFMNFELLISEPVAMSNQRIDRRQVIIRNVSDNLSSEVVQLLAENLAFPSDETADNEVIAVTKSQCFKQTYAVQLKCDTNWDQLNERLQRRPTLQGNTLHLMQAYSTNTMIVKKQEPLSAELIESYFSAKSDAMDCFVSVRYHGDFLLISYEKEEFIDRILARKHTISGQELIVERFVNFDLLSSLEEEELTVTSLDEKNLKFLFLEQRHFEVFSADLVRLGARVSKMDLTPEGVYELKIKKTNDAPINEWLSGVNNYITTYFTIYETEIGNLRDFEDLEEDNLDESESESEEDDSESDQDELIEEDHVNGLKLFQLRVLEVEKFTDIEGKKLKVAIDAQKRSVHFIGTREKICQGKNLLKVCLASILVTTVPADEALAQLVFLKRNDLQNWLEKKSIKATIEADLEDGIIYVY